MKVTACFTSLSVTNRLPVKWLLRGSKSFKSLGPILQTGLVSGYGPKAGRLWTTFPTVPISSQAIYTSGWQVLYNKRRREASCQFLATDMSHVCSGIQALVLPLEKCLMSVVTNSKSDVYHLLTMSHEFIEDKIKFSASVCLLRHFFMLRCTTQSFITVFITYRYWYLPWTRLILGWDTL